MSASAAAAQPAPLPAAMTLPLSGGDQGTVETVQHMCRLVDEGSKDPYVNELAIAIVHQARVRQFDFEGERRAIYRWFQQTVRFFKDIAGKETLRVARETLSKRAGDCDCQTIAMGSLLKTIGHSVRIVTISSHPQAPDMFSHVFLEVRDKRGRWIPMDAARRQAAYGRGPNHWFRRREWYTDGSFEDISGMGLGYMGAFGARGFGLRGLGAAPRRRRHMAGLGQSIEQDLANVLPAITTGTANIIAASRANPLNLVPYTGGTTTGTLTPAAQALIDSENPLASIGGSTWLLIGGALLVVVFMSSRGR